MTAFSGNLQAGPSPEVDSLIAKASYLFDYENFRESIEAYETALKAGYCEPNMLYRLAYMHEQTGNYPASIFYLRKLEWETGGDNFPEKIEQLMGKAHRERLSSGESWSSYRLFVNHYFSWLAGLLVLLSVLTAALVIPKLNGILTAIGLFSGSVAVIIALMLIGHYWFHPQRAVMIQPTSYYEQPAFGAPYRNLPIGTGATVTLLEKKDIWYHIEMNQFDAWVPEFTLRVFTE